MASLSQGFLGRLDSVLETRDIVQIDATVIAGALIFLSIANLFTLPSTEVTPGGIDEETEELLRSMQKAANDLNDSIQISSRSSLAAIIATPFALSAVVALLRVNGLAIIFMIFGFFVVIGGLFYIANTNYELSTAQEAKYFETRDKINDLVDIRRQFLDETLASANEIQESSEQYGFAAARMVEYCDTFGDFACDESMANMYEYCLAYSNQWSYCTDPKFIGYIDKHGLR